jgi:hypothetical protein
MDLTLADIIKYIKRKPRNFILFFVLGLILSSFYSLSNISKKNIEYAIVTDHIFWEAGINFVASQKQSSYELRVNNRYLAFIETVKLNIDTDLTKESRLKLKHVKNVSCEKRSDDRIMICNNILENELVDEFVEKNKKILNYIIDDEIKKISKHIQNDLTFVEVLEHSSYIEGLLNDFKSLTRESKHTINIPNKNYLVIVFIAFVPLMLYLVLLIILLPHIFLINKKN